MNIDLHELANILNDLFERNKSFIRDKDCRVIDYHAHVAKKNKKQVLVIDLI